MDRRQFVTSSALGSLALLAARFPHLEESESVAPAATRKIFIMGGGFEKPAVIRYMRELTGKPRPKLLFLPTASADSQASTLAWYRACATEEVTPLDQASFIASARQDKSWEEVLLTVDGIVASGGNTLNQQAIWKAQGIDQILRRAWEQGIVLGGASAGSLCWFEEGTTDSRPNELSIVKCLGFIPGSHSPHYDAEKDRRPLYMKLVASGELKPGYACYNDAGIYFEGTTVKRVVKTRADARVFYVDRVNGQAVERELPAEMIS